jgi:hypothetical protein
MNDAEGAAGTRQKTPVIITNTDRELLWSLGEAPTRTPNNDERSTTNSSTSYIPTAEKEQLLRRYWTVPDRQIETSVVLADTTWRTLNPQ